MSNERSARRTRLVVKIFTASIFALMLASLLLIANGIAALAQGGGNEAVMRKALAYLGAGLATGLAGIGGGYAVGQAGAAMIAAMTEKPEMFGRMFIVLVLGEGIALYGLLIAILLMYAVG